MSLALKKDFSRCLHDTDENSRAYRGVLNGEIPNDTSSSSPIHVSSRLLTMRFVDILCSLSAPMEETLSDLPHPAINVSGLESIVSFLLS